MDFCFTVNFGGIFVAGAIKDCRFVSKNYLSRNLKRLSWITLPVNSSCARFAVGNTDSDGDGAVDGWESWIGSDILGTDSYGDGVIDGQELLVYDRSDPDPDRGYGEPCSDRSTSSQTNDVLLPSNMGGIVWIV